jgi:hypothetical protein
VRAELAAGQLKDIIHSAPTSFARIDGALGVKDYLDYAAQLTPSAVVADFRARPQADASKRRVSSYGHM